MSEETVIYRNLHVLCPNCSGRSAELKEKLKNYKCKVCGGTGIIDIVHRLLELEGSLDATDTRIDQMQGIED